MTGRERVLAALGGSTLRGTVKLGAASGAATGGAAKGGEGSAVGASADMPPLMPITMGLAADMAGATYREYATDWRSLVEGQSATAARFGFDYVSAISDPCVESSDLGANIIWLEDQSPANDDRDSLLANKADLASLPRGADPASLPRSSNRLAAVSGLKARCGEALVVEGWVEGP